MKRLAVAPIWGALSLLLLVDCYSGSERPGGDPTPTGGGGTGGTPEGVPCEVANAIAACGSCHSSPPISGVPMALRTDADLKASSKTPAPGNAARMLTYAELSIARMQDTKSPMPPGGPTPTQAGDIAAIQSWINTGYPSGSCGNVDAGIVVYPTVCTSGMYTMGEDIPDKNLMHPGGACNTCHATEREKPPIFSIAGTVYSTYHEKNDCNAASSVRGSQVIITGADGRTLTLAVNATGNFHSESRVALPFRAKVIQNGQERVMQAAQTVGDCNTCHSEQGTSAAPGRIMTP